MGEEGQSLLPDTLGRRVIFWVVAATVVAGVQTLASSAAVWRSNGGGAPAVGQYIVVLGPNADRGAVADRARGLGGQVTLQFSHALNGFALRLPAAALDGIAHDPRVEFVADDTPVAATAAPPVCPLDTTSGLPTQCVPPGTVRIGAEGSSTRSGNGRGTVNVNVAVLDTGIDGSHPDLNVVGGTNCSPDKLPATADPGNHGTFVSGIIAARDNDQGVVGIAPGANLYSVRVLTKNGTGTVGTIICGIDWVTATRTDADPANDIAVANMSLGGKGSDDGNCGRTNKDALHLAICGSVAAGVTYVVGAGNSASDLKDFAPAAYDEVLTLAGMADFDGAPGGLGGTCGGSADDTFASFSNYATLAADQAHTVAAPAVCDVSTYPVGALAGTNYAIWSGTSFATPYGTGTVALCIASGACAGLTPAQIVPKIVADAAVVTNSNPAYGYAGDPLHPTSGRYFGYLLDPGLY